MKIALANIFIFLFIVSSVNGKIYYNKLLKLISNNYNNNKNNRSTATKMILFIIIIVYAIKIKSVMSEL